MHHNARNLTVPESARFSGRLMLWVGYALPLAGYAVTILLAPLDVLEKWLWCSKAADWVHSVFLSLSSGIDIYRHARTTTFPQVAKLASLLGILVVFVMVAAMFIHLALHFRQLHVFIRSVHVRSIRERLTEIFGFPAFGIFCMWACFCLGGDPSSASGFTTDSRFGYVLISSGAIAMAGGALGTSLVQFRVLVQDFILGNKS